MSWPGGRWRNSSGGRGGGGEEVGPSLMTRMRTPTPRERSSVTNPSRSGVQSIRIATTQAGGHRHFLEQLRPQLTTAGVGNRFLAFDLCPRAVTRDSSLLPVSGDDVSLDLLIGQRPLIPLAIPIVTRSPSPVATVVGVSRGSLSKWLSRKDFFVDDRRV